MTSLDSLVNKDLVASKINDRSPTYRKLAIIVTSIICLLYITYRGLFTLNLSTTYATTVSIMLYVAELFGVISLFLFFLQVWEVNDPPLMPILEGRTVDVFVPTYNEDPLLLRATLQACVAMDYPHKTYLCDDGGTEQRTKYPEPDDPDYDEKKKKADEARARQAALKAICEELGVIYCTRPKNEHAKAGNLNYAFERTDGEFMIIFDADHVPEPNFITRLIGYFADENLAFVQTPHAFYNFNSFQALYDPKAKKYWEEGQLFYQVIQPGRNRWNCPIFAGSAAMFRRQALKEVGYIATETITEDMHTGMRMNARGWKSMAIRDRLVAGQAAPDVTTFHTQRLRWGEGNISIMFYDNPLTMRGLTWPQRLCHFASMINWTGGVFKMMIYATPILMLFTGVPPVNQFTWLLLTLTLLYLISVMGTVKYVSNGHGSIINSEIYTMMGFWTQVRATFRAIFWRKFQSFVVTQKRGRQTKSIYPFIRPHLILVAASILALGWAWARPLTGISDDYYKPIIPTFWTVVNMLLALYVIRRALAPDDQRYSYRHQVHLPVTYERADGTCGAGITIDLSEQGLSLVTYERLQDQKHVLLALQTPTEIVECTAEIRHYQPWNSGQFNQSLTGFRYGLKFIDLTNDQRDAISRICIHYAVARLYNIYAPNQPSPLMRLLNRIRIFTKQKRYNERRDYKLPVVIYPEDPDGVKSPVFAITENVSRQSLAVLLSSPLTVHQSVAVFMPTPLGDVHGRGRVVRNKTTIIGAHRYEYCVVEIEEFQGTGRTILNSLIHHPEGHQTNSVLNPLQQPWYIPIAKPALKGIIRLVPLAILTGILFAFIHRDLYFLRDVKDGRLSVSNPEVKSRLLSLYSETYLEAANGGYPSNDRLVLLIGALRQAALEDRIVDVTLLLAPRDEKNNQLQLAYAYALDFKATQNADSGQRVPDPQFMWQKADRIFKRLIRLSRDGHIEASQQELLLGAARNAVHAANDRGLEGKTAQKNLWLDTAINYYQLFFTTDTSDLDPQAYRKIRNEYAGILALAQRFEELDALYASEEPDDDAKILHAQTYAAREAFHRVEEICSKLLDKLNVELKNPEQLDNTTLAKLESRRASVLALLAQSLAAQKDAARSERYYRELAKTSGKIPEIALRLAELDLQQNKFESAIEQLKPLVMSAPDKLNNKLRPLQVYVPFINAAAGIKDFPNDLEPAVKKVAEYFTANKSALDPVLTTRLAYVLNRAGMTKESTELLAAAYQSRPQDRKIREQYIANLIEQKQYFDAARLLEQEDDPQIRRMLVGVYIKEKNLAMAESEALKMLKIVPEDLDVRRALAEVYAMRGDVMSAIVQLETLLKKNPNDSSIQQRLGEVYLMAGDQQAAMSKFQELLSIDFNQPKLWEGFINSAVNSPRLSSRNVTTALQMAEILKTSEALNPEYQSRLAWILYRVRRLPIARELANAAASRALDSKAEVKREIAGVLIALESYNPALKLLQSIQPPTIEDRLQIARIYSFDPSTIDKSVAELATILNEQPDNVDANLLLAENLMLTKRYDDSFKFYNRVRQLRPDDLMVDLRLAQVSLIRKDYDRAISIFESIFDRFNNTPPAKLSGTEPLQTPDRQLELWYGFIDAAASCSSRCLTGTVRRQLMELADQIEATKKIDDAVYLGRLGAVLRRIDRPERALVFLQRAHELDPASVYLRTMLRDTLYDLGRFNEAERHNRILLQARTPNGI